MSAPPVVAQTTYAELLERCANAAFNEAFAEEGAFTPKTIKGRRYWYFQAGSGSTRAQRYVGPETPELLERIAHHREARDYRHERRPALSMLATTLTLPRPVTANGD